ncbi:MAG TPA: gamma-glutamylcyclotransferase [Gemmatimonadaceae bacterium]|nr:gamma-glutamylcyclotransferase [Gemmatimonadaceae bacterium]
MIDVDGVSRTLRRLNALRHGAAGPAQVEQLRVLEEVLDQIFRASRTLAVYGSLAPGRENHQVVQHLGGDWSQGEVEGERYDAGWGAPHGYPAMRWIPGAQPVEVQLLIAPELAAFWPTLDAFEGSEYRRSLVPVMRDGSLVAVANLYECRECPTAPARATGQAAARR